MMKAAWFAKLPFGTEMQLADKSVVRFRQYFAHNKTLMYSTGAKTIHTSVDTFLKERKPNVRKSVAAKLRKKK